MEANSDKNWLLGYPLVRPNFTPIFQERSGLFREGEEVVLEGVEAVVGMDCWRDCFLSIFFSWLVIFLGKSLFQAINFYQVSQGDVNIDMITEWVNKFWGVGVFEGEGEACFGEWGCLGVLGEERLAVWGKELMLQLGSEVSKEEVGSNWDDWARGDWEECLGGDSRVVNEDGGCGEWSWEGGRI
ncbi:hypothetical protein Tsubulata_018628 [Turnera subulata]|uniref:Uncharacterized protein n=1 Tax=Turnera subulata TaxID=218843 RepID=A0A9Q0F119_9ROSI|nr:hypothetical protein Tsubulata_018628 [Turnera subulata]